MDVIAGLQTLIAACGSPWVFAALAVLVAAASEGAKPKDAEITRGALGVLPGVAALVAPLLLLVHGFWAVAPHQAGEVDGPTHLINVLVLVDRGALLALAVVIAVLLFAPTALGWAIGKVSPAAGRVLYRVSPWLNAAALAYAAFVTYRSVATVLDLAMSPPS